MTMYKEHIKPIVVLLIICLIIGGVLGAVNTVTAPIIEKNVKEAEEANYYAVLPEADTFTSVDVDIPGVKAALKADNGAGYVVIAEAGGYNAAVPAAVSFSEDGKIKKVLMTENEETPGMGQKVRNDAFQDQFAGWDAAEISLADIDAVSGATISSRAAVNAINLAIQAYNKMKGGN